jgi:heterodisulfide reductase subunit C2
MTVKITKNTSGDGLSRKVTEISGVDISRCYQCQKCTGGCPVAGLTQSPPSEIVRRLQLGAGSELLASDLVWMCLSCETCYARCPMQINIAAIIDALRKLAREAGAPVPKGNVPLFNKEFLRMVKAFGRSYDLSMILGYKLGTGNVMQDTDKFPTMLKKGKMAVMPPSGADKKTVQRIFRKVAESKGTGK